MQPTIPTHEEELLVFFFFSFFLSSFGKAREGGQSQKNKVEKPQDGRKKSCQNMGNHYQMEDNKALYKRASATHSHSGKVVHQRFLTNMNPTCSLTS